MILGLWVSSIWLDIAGSGFHQVIEKLGQGRLTPYIDGVVRRASRDIRLKLVQICFHSPKDAGFGSRALEARAQRWRLVRFTPVSLSIEASD